MAENDSVAPRQRRGVRDFGERVRRYRNDRGWTQAQLAKAASLSKTTVSRLERGLDRPLEKTTRALATALGVETDRLLGLEGQPALFPRPDERRLDLLRRLMALSDDHVEQGEHMFDEVFRRLERKRKR